MTKKEAKIRALKYTINTSHPYTELNDEEELYTESAYDKIQNAIDREIEMLESKLARLRKSL